MGFKSIGDRVLLSDRASFYGCSRISIANDVRIDDFCVISAGERGISIGNYVHMAVYTSLIGAGRIVLSDYCNLSSRVSIYSSSDDYSGEYMTNPMVPVQCTNVKHADVFLGRHVIVGCGSVVLPGVTLEDGVAVGALSLIVNSCSSFEIYAGSPAKRIKPRKRDLLLLEKNICISTVESKQ
ncbi:galactoside O-acetyltransferase [Mariprofundus ferrinatatus]|uniref:Galactoside O-acetyltransferase n=2 Tax=Mariprofundus ferrinatatus TaxID=1921087 RepID=A0A2K8L441_9PROT|nr:galactoside O-acetyltransferase [Mariprofundus ferrinatatus]